MATKIYIKKGCNNYVTSLKVKNCEFRVEFADGNVLMNIPARLATSDEFLQYLLERDERFCKVWFLSEVLGGTKKEAKKEVKAEVIEVPEVTNLNEAIDWFAERGKVCTNKATVKEAMASMKVSFPNYK